MANEPLSKWKKIQADALALWQERWGLGEYENRPFWLRLARFCLFVGRSFVRNRCPVRASSLAYTTLLALIPVLAVGISISTSLMKSDKAQQEIERLINLGIDKAAPQLGLKMEEGKMDNRKQIIELVSNSIKTVQSGTLGATAAITLVIIAVSLLASIESTINDIWGLARGRSWLSRVIYYWAVITLGPILILSAVGLVAKQKYQFVQGWISGSSSTVLAPKDIVDVSAFGKRLSSQTNPISVYLYEQLPETTKQAFAVMTPSAIETERLRSNLVANLNDIITNKSIYETNRFEHVPLRPETKQLLASHPSDESNRVQLNRLLLEDAYPLDLSHPSPFTDFVAKSLSVGIMILAFALFYFLMPNTKVEWRAALLGGIIAGGLLTLNAHYSTLYFGQVIRNSKFWGSLGVVPVFLIGLYFSWMIVLFGAQVAYAFQNRHSYFQEKQAENINQRGREFVAMRLMTLLAQRFAAGAQPPTLLEIGETLSVPTRLISRTLEPLLQTKLVVEVAGAAKAKVGVGYFPARPLDNISCQNILDAMRAGMGLEVATKDDPSRAQVRDEFEKIRQAEREVASKVTLKDLVEDTMPTPARS